MGQLVIDGLSKLLASYAEPCIGDCDHSQCPLLRELHALRIKATLEQARLTVKPIVDREKKGEEIGDLMNVQLRTPAMDDVQTTENARAATQELERSNWLLSDATPEELASVAAIIKRHFASPVQVSVPASEGEQQVRDHANDAANKIAEYFNAPPSVIAAVEGIITRCFKAKAAMPHDEMERDAMIDTIKELERDRDELRQVARMSLQQFEFTYGKRGRGWDAAYLMERVATAITNSQGSAPADLAPVAQPPEQSFQDRVRPWMIACFGAEIAADKEERNHRFLEEALELVQSCGATRSEAHQLVDYTFDRPADPPEREVGGVMVTLAALCLAQGFDMHECGETELSRVWGKIEVIRAKQAAKPKHSPLPEHAAASLQPPSPQSEVTASGIIDQYEPHEGCAICPDCYRVLKRSIASALTNAQELQREVDARAYQRRLFEECRTANWDPDLQNSFAEEIAHLHEELSEAFRAWRKYKDCGIREVSGKLEGVPIELADALIGMFYNAELHGFDLFAAVEQKHQFNLTRNYVREGRQLHAGDSCS